MVLALSEVLRDVRFGVRLLLRSPVFALTVVLILGVGIGANTLIFSMVDSLLLRPLPVKDPERLVRLIEVHPTGFITWELPYVLCDDLTQSASSLTDGLCQGNLDVAFEGDGFTERIRINAVSSNFFSTLGIRALRGRVLTPEDDQSHTLHAVVSYDFWRRRLGGSDSVVGRTIRLNGRAFTVVGVLPRGVNGLSVDTSPDVRIPFAAARLLTRQVDPHPERALFLTPFQIFARLRPGVSLRQAQAEVDAKLPPVYREATLRAFPELAKLPRGDAFASRLQLEPAGHGISALRQQFSRGLTLLMGSVALLLLMACGNVACLLLARSAARSREITMRLTLGADRSRVVRQLLTESLLLGLSGGVLGVLLTGLFRPLLLAALPPVRDRAAVLQPLAVHLDIDWRVLAFAVCTSLLTVLFFGLAPALIGARKDLAGSLRGNRTTTAHLWGRNVLVAAQVAVCVLLLAGAGVLVETFGKMRAMNPGFDRDHIVTFAVDPGLRGYKPDGAKLVSQKLLQKARELPGVVDAALAARGLMRGTGVKTTLGLAGKPISRGDFLNCSVNEVTPGYFDTMGIRVLAGRDFSWSEYIKVKPSLTIVNEAFVRRFFPGQNAAYALGKRFGGRGADGLASAENQILGVVTDAKYRSLREPVPPTIYNVSVNGFADSFILHLRTRSRSSAFIAPVREILRSIDPELAFVEVSTLREDVDASIWQERLLAFLSLIFGSFAALLAGLGLYGTLDFAVRSRTREVGVRVALGATPLRIIQLLSHEVGFLLLAGAAGGVALYLGSSYWIQQVLYEVQAFDPPALAAALLFVLVVAFLAAAYPIRRAVRIHPANALREE